MAGEYRWVRHLPPSDLEEFIDELARACRSGLAGNDLDALVASWRATAEVYADPELHAKLSSPTLEDFGPATCPEEDAT